MLLQLVSLLVVLAELVEQMEIDPLPAHQLVQSAECQLRVMVRWNARFGLICADELEAISMINFSLSPSPCSFKVRWFLQKCLLTTSAVLGVEEELSLLPQSTPTVRSWRSGCGRKLAFLSGPEDLAYLALSSSSVAEDCLRLVAAFCNVRQEVTELDLSSYLPSLRQSINASNSNCPDCLHLKKSCLTLMRVLSAFPLASR